MKQRNNRESKTEKAARKGSSQPAAKSGAKRKKASSEETEPTRRQTRRQRETGLKSKKELICFVMMPFTDPQEYPPDHFKRVYQYIIRPACEMAGFKPIRVDDVNTANNIVIDILRYIVQADMAVCDLSARSPNVLYELGIRHAFNRPVTLIKDTRTPRMFDIQGLRDIEYDDSLRADIISKVIPVIADSIIGNYEAQTKGSEHLNSVIQLLGVKPATLPDQMELSQEGSLLLNVMSEIRDRMMKVERLAALAGPVAADTPAGSRSSTANGIERSEEQLVFVQHQKHGTGVLRGEQDGQAVVAFIGGGLKAVPATELVRIGVVGDPA